MMTREDLDRVTAGGCGHRHAGGGACGAGGRLVLTGRCHPSAPSFLSGHTPGLVQVLCSHPQCPPVATLAGVLKGGGWRGLIFRQPCHPDSAVVVSYRHGSGVAEVACWECGAAVARIDLAAGPAATGSRTEGPR